MAIGLNPYLCWQASHDLGTLTKSQTDKLFAKCIYRFFTQEAIDRAHGATWNPEMCCVESPQDREVDELDEFDPEMDLSRFTDVNTDDATVHEKEGTRIRPHDVEADDDTLSTLGTAGTLTTIQEGQTLPAADSAASTTSSGASSLKS